LAGGWAVGATVATGADVAEVADAADDADEALAVALVPLGAGPGSRGTWPAEQPVLNASTSTLTNKSRDPLELQAIITQSV